METLSFGPKLGAIMQVGYVVEDMDAALRYWTENLAIGPFFVIEHFPLQDTQYRGSPTDLDVDIALAFSATMCFELIVQNSKGPSVYSEVVEKRGFGFHHWAVSTRDFDGDVARYRSTGAEMALYGVAEVGGRAAYMDTMATLSGMVELIEITPPVEEFFTMVQRASVGWDGTDPVRRLEVRT